MQFPPVVASQAGAMPDIIEDNTTGFLVPPGSSDDIAAAFLRVAAEERLRARLGNAGWKRFQDRLTFAQIVVGMTRRSRYASRHL